MKLSASSNLTKKINLIKQNGLERDFCCTEDHGISWSLSAALRILALEESKLSQWNKVLDGQPVSSTNEALVHTWISLIVSHTLEILETEDSEQCDQSLNMQLALQLRDQEKQILRKALCQLNTDDSSFASL